ncbi:DNA starvation/stationary phase protection protein [Algoriphagus halophytocola]|uniref:DNA starvation/stationary phase protection protein n=1 Tax=Algoriphagus halophytocola TaxID=2991499 RepID=A0ABY6MBJ3_9BACT|nr:MULTISPECIES: DNA starvation/stationary phase protection protein [unclassified Algoriphagus]UZD20942.1 DNA starvation/stationary phase protection protein [Algoriphagus sp. TR-M5]WBL42108.1 DNA starvation/stationary phase protection protein [Algoriphagus sp. TR-M9]
MKTNDIGLEIKESKVLTEKLNDLLANYQIYYQNLRNFHWNVTGPNFFELHAKFEELYNAANEAVDETAERILTLGARPLSSYQEYIEKASIKEAKEVTDPLKMVEIVKNNMNTLLKLERDTLEAAGESGDEGTASLMSDYITAKEKVVWMLSAYLK